MRLPIKSSLESPIKSFMKFWILAAATVAAPLVFAQQTQTPAPTPHPQPKVLFSGQPLSADQNPAINSAPVSDAERQSIVITSWDLDLHLNGGRQSIDALARVTLRNDSTAPMSRIPLQLSSTLNFASIAIRSQKIPFTQTTLPSDADHTGHLHEAVIPLADPLPPQSQLTLLIEYTGTIPLTAERLTAIGAPDATAQTTDWDRISEDFTGVRGFGNVAWYPVASVPVSLADGAKLYTEIGRQKLMDQDSTVSLRVTDEFSSRPPNAAVLDGNFVTPDNPTALPTASFPGIIVASLPSTRLGFETPSFFLARRTEVDGNDLRLLSTDANRGSADRYITAASLVHPLVRTWLGQKPRPPFTILDLPEPDDAPAETGQLLAAPLSADDPQHLAPIVIHALARGAFSSPRAWLNEGVAAFIGSLWIESTQGRTAAVENLNADRPALALVEPATPGQDSGEDLLHAVSAVYYRTKAQYVLWMLRDIAGEKTLQTTLQAYDPAQDTTPGYFEHLLEQTGGVDLKWFFDDWVNRDRGLPDLSIASVYPSRESNAQVLVAVDIMNEGYAAAEVPITAKGVNASVTERVRIPPHGRITHRIAFQESPVEIDLNDGTVPEVRDSIHQRLLTSQ
jgi:hypothetical protein